MASDRPRRARLHVSNRKAQLTLLAIALVIVVLLVGITRYEWLEIKPARGTAAALAVASDGGAAGDEASGRAAAQD